MDHSKIEMYHHKSNLVKHLMDRLDISREILSLFLGVPIGFIHDWEAGKPIPPGTKQLLEEMVNRPNYWYRRVRESISIKRAKDETDPVL